MLRLFFGLFLVLVAIGPAQSRPNIIIFFSDDLGYGDLGCFWQDQRPTTKKFDTPALDRMAAEGAKLTHHYVAASVCAPSRASLLTGRHQGHCEVRNSQFDKALPANHTIASVLQAAGYRTIHIGKNGLAGTETSTNLTGTGSQNLAAHPLDRGFDRFFGYLFHSDGHEHYPRNGTTNKTAHIYDDYQQITHASVDLYTTDAWTAAAKREIINEATDGDDQPFFLYIAYDAPHFNMQRPAVAYPPIDNDGDPLTGGIQWTTATDGSGKVRYASTADGTGTVDGYTHPDIPAAWAASEKQHVGMIRRIDNSVADILQTLKDLGIDDNTLCIFSSDNGPHNEGNNPRTFESFANMEGIKRDLWEAGIRVPTIVRWPGNIAGATGNEAEIHEIDYPSALWDWMPSFCELAGVPAPAWCDGVSLLPTLTGSGAQRDKGYLYFEFQNSGSTPDWAEFPNHRGEIKGEMQALRIGNHMGVRTGISTGSEPFKIYDVTTDPGQATDLASSLPDLAAKMQTLALTARRPGGGVSRPYDGLALPAVSFAYELASGVDWRSFTDPGATWQWVPEFRDLTATATGTTTNIRLDVRPGDEHFGMLYSGFIEIPTAGNYTFRLDSDTGADFFLHDGHLIANDFNHSPSATSGTVNLEAGLHPYRLYYRHATGARNLSLQWSGPGLTQQPVPDSALFAATPLPLKAVDDLSTTIIGQSVLIDVLANDLDDGLPSPISIQSVGTPDFGTAALETGKIRYTPPAGFEGTASFSYTITDGDGSDSATVTVNVVPQQPPSAVDDETATSGSLSGPGDPVTIPVLANDSDPDGGPSPLSISSVGVPIGGGVVISGNDLVYTPDKNFIGTDAFPYTVSDGAAAATARVVVEVSGPSPGNLTAYWDFEGANPSNVSDSVSSTVGTLVGSAAVNGAAIAPTGANSLSLPSSGSYFDANTNGGLAGTGSFTVFALIRHTADTLGTFFNYSPSANQGGRDLRLFVMGNGGYRIEMTAGAFFELSSTDFDLSDGNTHAVAAVFDSSTGDSFRDVDLYVDGKLYNVTSGTDHLVNLLAGGTIQIGRDQVSPTNRPFVGQVDDVVVYNEALSLAQLDELAAQGVPSAELNLFSIWMANADFGLRVEDRAFDADPDGDTLANGLEAWFGTHPGVANAGLTILMTEANETRIQHPQNPNPPANLSASYEWSPDLSDWFPPDGVSGPTNGTKATSLMETTDGIRTVTITTTPELGALFLRLAVTQE